MARERRVHWTGLPLSIAASIIGALLGWFVFAPLLIATIDDSITAAVYRFTPFPTRSDLPPCNSTSPPYLATVQTTKFPDAAELWLCDTQVLDRIATVESGWVE